MPSSYTASLRLNLQATGENVNVWGNLLNTGGWALVDFSVAGWLTKALTTDYTLTSANGTTDEARAAMLKFTGTGAFAVTIPAVSKRYDVWNACTGILTVSNGSASVTLQPGEKVGVMTDGGANIARVQPTDFGGARITSVGTPTSNTDAATKRYVDDTAFAANTGILPGQPGNADKFLKTNGTVAGWSSVTASDVGLGAADNTAVLGKHAIWIPASAMIQRTTNGAAFGLVETATNKVMLRTLDYDASVNELAQFTIRMPKSWNEGTVTFRPVWSHAATTTNFGVSWGLRAVAIGDVEAVDAAFGTPQNCDDTGGVTNTLYIGPESSAVTIAGTPQAEDWVVFEVYRETASVNDTLAIDARLHGLTLYITNNAGTDA